MKKLLLGLIAVVIGVLVKQGVIFNASEPDFQRSAESVLSEAMMQVDQLCLDRAKGHSDSFDYHNCLDTAHAYEDLCKQRILSQIPSNLTSLALVNQNKRRMQKCIVPSS
ncbi:hypothetical protein FE810_03940 [Thalassotalea litorea]|uniref:Uncharacterized protein n=1 Tax=Thalassotalea litorea TaxID=2020715 RepID=A0A5R9IN21_9GAMM|nr:hypothetical protein [Thalassotalea litorea]TLU66672.1 hypothetical protein FE810_03940 [Thalassotalea litorea]